MPLEIVGEGPEETFASGWSGCTFLGDPQNVDQFLAKFNAFTGWDYADWGDIDIPAYETATLKHTEYFSKNECGGYAGPFKRWPCRMYRYNWDGGWGAKANIEYFDSAYNREGGWDNFLKTGAMVLNVASVVLDGASKAVSSFAKNDLKKDLQGAKDKFAVAQTSLDSAGQQLDVNANKLSGISQTLGTSGPMLVGMKEQIDLQLPQLNLLLSNLNAFKSVLNGLMGQLASANNAKAYASIRANFPKGIGGATAQKNALNQANADIARISKFIVDYEETIHEKSVELKDKSDIYNNLGRDADTQKAIILVKTGELNSGLSERKELLDNAGSAIKLQNGAMNDVSEAQDTFAGKMETSVGLSSGAMGASGASSAIKYVRTGEYFNAGGALLASGVNIYGNYYPKITPYEVFIQSAIIDGMYTLQTNGSVLDYSRKFAESTLMLESAKRVIESFAVSFEVMEQDPYFAFQNMAVETHAGVGIIGRWLMVASPFVPGGAVVSPLLPVATKVVQNVTAGAFSTGVELGKKIADNKWSAKIGSGETSVLMTGIAGLYITLTSPFTSIFGGANPAIEVQRMAMTGAGEIVKESGLVKDGKPQMRFSVDLAPTRPEAEWWYGREYGGAMGELK